MARTYFYLLMSICMMAGCSHAAAPTGLRPSCPDKAADDYYFAKGVLDPQNEGSDSFLSEWYSGALSAAAEPSLSCGKPGNVYRFTWLRTFSHPVVVSVEDKGKQKVVRVVELDGAGGYGPGKVSRRVEKALTAAQFDALEEAFDEADFDSMPTHVQRRGFDGSEWILETSGKQGYHVVVRWSPNDGPVLELGERMLAMTGLDFDAKY